MNTKKHQESQSEMVDEAGTAMKNEQKEKADGMFHAINSLALASGGGDKELSILQEALDTALTALEDNPKALSDIAQVVIDELGDDIDDISYMDCESDIELLKEAIS